MNERSNLLDYLGHYRQTFEKLCGGLSAEQLATRSVPPSSLSLLGLLRHLAKVEHVWFRQVMERQDVPRLYDSDTIKDHDFDGAVADQAVVEEAWESWRREVAHADEYLAQVTDMETEGKHHGSPIQLRDVLVHLIEEYARHCGHADLLRERVDGRTGI